MGGELDSSISLMLAGDGRSGLTSGVVGGYWLWDWT